MTFILKIDLVLPLGFKVINVKNLHSKNLKQARRYEKNSEGAEVYEILWATMVGQRRKFFISNCLKRLERLIFVVGEGCKFPS